MRMRICRRARTSLARGGSMALDARSRASSWGSTRVVECLDDRAGGPLVARRYRIGRSVRCSILVSVVDTRRGERASRPPV